MNRQFIPIPEYLTALLEYKSSDEHCLYDAVDNGECVFYVLSDDTKDEDSTVYCHDNYGTILFDPAIIVPTMHCKTCGQRMTVRKIPLSDDTHLPFIYTGEIIYNCCDCNLIYSKKHGWRYDREAKE